VGCTAATASARWPSSTSRDTAAPARPRKRLLTRPGMRLAPAEFVLTGPRDASAAARSRLVVVLPLVPDTTTDWWPAAMSSSARWSMARVTRPPMTEPSPAPTQREASAMARPAMAATRVRRGRSTVRILAQEGVGTVPAWRDVWQIAH
jgi:hypothetical protein